MMLLSLYIIDLKFFIIIEYESLLERFNLTLSLIETAPTAKPIAKCWPLVDQAQQVMRPDTRYFWTALTSADQKAKSEIAHDAKCMVTGL